MEQKFGHCQLQHSIAQKFKAFIVLVLTEAMFVYVGSMGKRLF